MAHAGCQMRAALMEETHDALLQGRGDFPTNVVVGERLLSRLSDFTGSEEAPFVVADGITGPLFAEFLGTRRGLFTLPRGEEGKNLENLSKIYAALAAAGLDRSGTLLALGGAAPSPPVPLRARASAPIRKRAGRTEYPRGFVTPAPDGTLSVTPDPSQGSGVLSSMSRANCIIVLPHDRGPVEAGEWVDCLPFEGLF